MVRKLGLYLIAAIIVGNIAFVAVFLTTDRDSALPDDVMDFERAVYGANYELMWERSTGEYRAGRNRQQFLDWARESTPSPEAIFNWTVVNEKSGELARSHTRIQLATGEIVMHRLLLNKVGDEWHVAEYRDYTGAWPPNEPPLP